MAAVSHEDRLDHQLDAERGVIGSLLIDESLVREMVSVVDARDFLNPANRLIFQAARQLFRDGRPVDALTIRDRVGSQYSDYMTQLMEITPTSANALEYAAIVRDKSLLRSVAAAAGEITALVQDGLGEAQTILEAAEQKIYAIRRGRSAQDLTPVGQVLKPVLDRLNALASGEEGLPGLPSGFSAVDQKIHGLNRSDLVLLAARPGMGKSSFALNMALDVAKQSKKTVAVFSLEMSKEQLVTRLLSSEGLVELGRLLTGRLSPSDWGKVTQAARTLRQTDIRIDDNPMLTVADMNAKCRRIEDLGMVVIDYLQLMNSSGGKSYAGESRQQAVSDISRMLKIMAKELDVPVLCLSQLSRANEKREDKRPMLSDLRDSGAIEQDADIVMFLYREDYYKEDSEKKNIAECIVAKNRHGEAGKVPLRWMPEYTTFATLETRYDEE